MILWSSFFICTALIVYSGTRLSKYGDIIAEKTGAGRTWIGVVLMASVTSLPELVTGLSSVTYANTPDIAVGDILGSCMFNMLIIAFLDIAYRPMPIFSKAHQGNILSAGIGILMLSIVSMSMFLANKIPALGWVGPYSLLFILIYFIGMKLIYTYEKRKIAQFVKEMAIELQYKDISMRATVLNYTVNAIVVIIAAMFLPKIGKGIAVATGLGETFVGNILIAASTSLPEVVVSFAAIRIGAVDMAIGNLFGSNIFNVLILSIDDIFYSKGHILAHTDPSHIMSAFAAIAMTAIAVIGLTYRAEKKKLLLAWDSVGIMLVYIISVALLYILK